MVFQKTDSYLDNDGFLNVPKIIKEYKIEKFFPGLLQNINEIRSKDFSRLDKSRRVYLDNGATTQEPESVIDRIYEHRKKHLRGSNHTENTTEAKNTQKDYEKAKRKIQNFFHAKNFYIALTSGTTAASNLLSTRFNFKKEDLLLITDMEHNSQVLTARNYATSSGAEVKYIPIKQPNGELDLEFLEKTTSGRKGKILLMLIHASNVTGIVNHVGQIKKKLGNVLIYLDMAQSAGHMSINLDEMDVDFAGVSAHKMYGPMGMGAFFINKKSDKYLGNFLSGGGAVKLVGKHDAVYEDSPVRFEPGTQNIEGVIEWGFVIDFLKKIGMNAIRAHDKALGEYFINELKKISEIHQLEIYGPTELEGRIPVFTFNIGYSKTNYVEIAKKLDKSGISVRDGCFCAHLLLPQLLGVTEKVHNSKIKKLQKGANFDSLHIEGAVRASFAFYNTPIDAYKAVQSIRKIYQDGTFIHKK